MRPENTGAGASGGGEPNPPSSSSALGDLVLVLARYWRSIALLTLVGTTAMVGVSLLLPKWYEAEVRMLAPKRQGMQGMMLPQAPGAMAAMDLLGIMSGGTEPNVLANILRSRSVTDAVIAKFDLQRRYRAATMEETRRALWRHASVDVDRKSGVITLKAEDQVPQMARDLAAAIAAEGSKVNNNISRTHAGDERRFLEKRLADEHAELAKAEVALRDFSAKYKILDLKEQAKTTIQAVAKIRGEILAREVMLSYVSSFAGSGESSALKLRRELAEMKRQLAKLEEGPSRPAGARADGGTAPDPGASSVVTPIAQLPERGLEFARLFREVKIRETVFELLTRQHELAKLAEVSETANALIIDPPVVPTYKVRPKRANYVILGFLVCFALGVGLAHFRETLATDPAAKARWRALGDALRGRRRVG